MVIDTKMVGKRLKSSRTLWAGLIAFAIVIARAVWPEFPISDVVIESSLVLLGGYILSEGIEGFRPAENILETLKASRKFWITLSGLIVLVAKEFAPEFPLDQATVILLINMATGLNITLGVEGFTSK